jgi:hypothetical protein
MWEELKKMVRTGDDLSEMLMDEDVHKLKFTKKEDPRNLLLNIAKITV